jgi:ABC-type glycerol-3-phosphate transport system permease component
MPNLAPRGARSVLTIVFNAAMLAIGLAMLYPFIWMISSSLKPDPEIYGSTTLLPSKIMWSNFVDGWRSIKPYTYTRFYANTAFLVVLGTAGALLSTTGVGYGFARIRFRAATSCSWSCCRP